MKTLQCLFGAMVAIFLLVSTMVCITNFRSQEYTEPHSVITLAGHDDANVTLSQDLFSGHAYNVINLASDNGNDLPIPSNYVANTNQLTIIGLEANTTRTMTITYRISALDDYFGADILAKSLPVLIGLGIFALIGCAIYSAFPERGGE